MSRERDPLGLERDITRRDFVHLAGAGIAGAAFLGCADGGTEDAGSTAGGGAPVRAPDRISDPLGPDWYGPGGVGDYASSHGNTPEVIGAAHRLRDDGSPAIEAALETGERYDVIIVGGGLSGLSAAHHFTRLNPNGRCLLLENHPVFGGEAKRNELEVDGVRLIGPQGSNDFGVLPATGGPDDYFTSLGMPREFEYAPDAGGVRSPLENYGFLHWLQDRFSIGHHFGPDGGWVRDLWNDTSAAPWSDDVRAGFERWRAARVADYAPAGELDDPRAWLDSMTLKAYYEDVLGLPPEVTAYVDPILASIIGLGCDAISAWWGYHFDLPGFGIPSRYDGITFHSFPGGNAEIARYFVKDVIPDAIEGAVELGDVITGRIAFAALDRDDAPVRIRLASTVTDVRHAGAVGETERVRVTYVNEGRAYVAEASGVVMATGGWMNEYVLHDLPTDHRAAYANFHHAPVLVANVALRNWRFLERLGIAGCMYEGDIGFSCTVRRPMYAGDHRPPFDPDQPTMLTFYITFESPGLTPGEQGIVGRAELLATPFRAYERRIREQMVTLFGEAGFDPANDVAGLVLNRWGHAYVAPGPGFFVGRNGAPAPPDVIREPFGRIAIGHSELRGHQNWTGAAAEGRRALEAALDRI
ncbi:MAG: NAD(P)/FAD-dependent oxidoreductase [Gemmatimonadetes bacterium]|nr:NAD(P)/FAD-dependent oxidoreductase [Gemmatimonadota bacterium]